METLSLFDMVEQTQEQMHIPSSASLDVVKMEFAGAESCTWQELFSGFDTLHAITYSSGIDFVYQLIDLFEDAEILFGCDEVISYSLQEVMAYQCKMVERMRSTASKMKLDLVSRIDQGTLRFFVARSVLSHEKLYLLSGKDGRKRVIMGSANLSRSAFGGYQRENICYLDGDAAYDWYWDCYCQLREDCTDQIAKETLLLADNGEHLYGLSDSPVLLGELLNLLRYRYEQIDFIDEPVDLGFDSPLDLHCTYTRDQLLVAMDFLKPATVREGVKWLPEKNLDVFFITLNKSDKDYSPTTLYKDYSINERLFHWQSQSTTAADSPTGQRYIHHRERGSKVLLFVREFKADRITGGAEAYTFLGTASYVKHEGSKPMNITWKLDRPIPAKFLKKTNKLVVG